MTSQANIFGSKQISDIRPRYTQLKKIGETEFRSAGRDELVIRNRLSALNTFLKFLRITDQDVVGNELGAEFDRELMRWCDHMRDKGMAARTVEDRCGFLENWREIATRLAKTDTLPEEFSGALKESMERRGCSARVLSRLTGIGSQAIAEWISCKRRPARDVASQIEKLENALLLPTGTLAKRLGFVIERYRVTKAARKQKDALTAYGKRLRSQYQSGVRLNYLRAPHDNVRIEWAGLMAHKVNEFRERASKRDTWRVKPDTKSGSKGNWASRYAGGRVAAADAAWGYISRYLSWLCLSPEHGGAGLTADRVSTLAWVLRDDLIQRGLQWMRMRSGGKLHLGQVQLLNYACMLLRPKTGWLWLNPQIANAFGPGDLPSCLGSEYRSNETFNENWRNECARIWGLYKSQADMVRGSRNLEKGREPTEPIQDILAAKAPLSIVMQMLATLMRNPPPATCFKSKAVWYRDVLLISFLSANPLRAQHFSTMTYRPDGSGNLYKDGADWCYRAASEEFKNAPGAYEVTLPGYVGRAIEDYLEFGRKHLYCASESEYVFMPARCGPQTVYDETGTELPTRPTMWTTESIGIRVRLITRGLRNGRPGFGPHAFRHIVATDYLKRHPGAFKLVAHLLNDSLETVIKEYGHVSPQDGLSLHYESADFELRQALGEENNV